MSTVIPLPHNLSLNTKKTEKKWKGKGDRIYKFQRFPTTKLVVFLSFLFLLTNKNAIIINPNKDSACCYVLSVVWPGG